jgi:hypothetical protein
MLKAPGSKRLKLKHDKMLSSFAFNSNVRRYTTAVPARRHGGMVWVLPSPTPLFGEHEPPLPDLPAVPPEIGPGRCCPPRHPPPDRELLPATISSLCFVLVSLSQMASLDLHLPRVKPT